MRIIDAQIHLYGENAEATAKRINQIILSPEQVVSAMDEAGVERAYLVPIGTEGNAPCVDAANRWPERFRVFAIILLNKPEARTLIADWRTGNPYLGVRLSFPPFKKVSWLKDGTAEWFWPEANRLKMPVMIWAPEQTDEVAKLAERFPDIRFIIDHLGLYVEDKGDKVKQAVDNLLPLAKYPNVAAKATALPCHSSEPYPFRDLHDSIKRIVDAFGAERVMWGTDLTRLTCSYRESITFFTEELKFLTPKDLEMIMSGTAVRWLGW